MRKPAHGIAAATVLGGLLGLLVPAAAAATSLQVEPVLLEVLAPGAASTVTLRNDGNAPINAQVRVYRWMQVDGQEKLEPTEDVVASPPALSLAPNGTHVVRVVRVSKRPLSTEESYRLLVDQIPNLSQRRNGMINMVLRHSIPVFFNSTRPTGPAVAWSVALTGNNIVVTARNSGDRRLRVSALQLQDSAGSNVTVAKGLVGYALAGATMQWTIPGGRKAFGGHGPVRITAQGDTGPIDGVAAVHQAR
jgi:fimbrial chaperone protein